MWVAHNKLSLSFLFLIGSVVLLVVTLPRLIAAWYHPNDPSSPYMPWVALMIWLNIAIGLLLTVHCLLMRKQTLGKLYPRIFLTIAGAELLAGSAIFLLVEPVPASFVFYVGADAYQVPSVYTQSRDGNGLFSIHYCANSWKGIYEKSKNRCQTRSVTLSAKKITSQFYAYYTLDKEMNITRKGDKIEINENISKYASDKYGAGWKGYTTYDSGDKKFRYAINIVLDNERNITIFGKCISDRYCKMLSKTEAGLLSYTYTGGQKFDYPAWRAHERKILDLLASWKIDTVERQESPRRQAISRP